MTYEEVKKIFRTKFLGTCCIDFENGDGTNECECPNSDCDNCRIAEAERMILDAIERQIPKKPHVTTMGYAYSAGKRTIRNCPYCYEVKGLGLWESLIDRPTPYCRRCGQAIDWSEVE